MDVYDKVLGIFADALCCPVEEVTRETTLADAGGDSLDGVELQMMLEEEFGCTIPDDAITFETTVKELADLVTPQPA